MEEKSIYQDESPFAWYQQVLIGVLLQMPATASGKEDMVRECRAYYYDNPAEIKKIDEFAAEYKSDMCVWWYKRLFVNYLRDIYSFRATAYVLKALSEKRKFSSAESLGRILKTCSPKKLLWQQWRSMVVCLFIFLGHPFS